jgi:lantibiotic biosynthesis protein
MNNQAVEQTLSKISSALRQLPQLPFALLYGNAGILMFNLQYEILINSDLPEHFQDSLEFLIAQSNNSLKYTFCDGKSGVHWFYSFLHKKGILEQNDWETLCDDNQLAQNSLLELSLGHYDFLHGALGTAFYLLYSQSNRRELYFTNFFNILKSLCLKSEMNIFESYDSLHRALNQGKVNVGLAHGIPSILKLCIDCIKQNICVCEAREIACHIITFLRDNQNENIELYYFPYFIEYRKKSDPHNRLAWCHGDLGIGFILYQAGQILQDVELKDFALLILLNTTKIYASADTLVQDAGICHGSAGIAHIYNKLWHIT